MNPVFTGVTIQDKTEAQRTIEKADGQVKFIGYYDAFTINTPANDDIYYMTSGDQLKHTGKERTLKACRAYFQFSENIVNTVREFVLNFGNGEITGITTTNSTNSDGAWYTIDGRKLDKQPTRKGLYIFNGKVVIK